MIFSKKTNSPESEPANTKTRTLQLAGCLLSGVLTALSFPGAGIDSLAWIGLIPLMLAVRTATPQRSVLLGWIAGFSFFMVSLFWLHNLMGTVEGNAMKLGILASYAALAAYCGIFFIPISVLFAYWMPRFGFRNWRHNLMLMLLASIVWTGSEYLRSILFTGFPWNLLGVSQYKNVVVIQISSWGGVYAVSALLVWMNTALFITLLQYILGDRKTKYRPHAELMLGVLLVAMAAMVGLRVLFARSLPDNPVRLALIQPNIPQVEKWDKKHTRTIYERLEELTFSASRIDETDLIVWPETALPDFLRVSRPSRELVTRMTAQGTPLLAGSMDVDFSGARQTYFNSSMLYGTNGTRIAKYDKQHLVPFGEYVPFPGLLRKFTPIEADFIGGEESTIFNLNGLPPFSALICFEDIIPPLAAKAVRNGARWLINQTNDAWFDPSAQSEQHMAHAVFRCVENRISMARCCNTGISCIIDSYGNVQRALDPRTAGFSTKELYPAPADQPQTFYTRHGDLFAKSCLILTGILAIVPPIRARRQKPTKQS